MPEGGNTLDDAYNNFAANEALITVDAAELQTTGIKINATAAAGQVALTSDQDDDDKVALLVETITASTGDAVSIDNDANARGIFIDHDDTGTTASLEIDRDGNNAGAIIALMVDAVNPAGAAYPAVFTGGNVGIGTAAPQEELHISTTLANDAKIRVENTGTGNAGIEFFRSNIYGGGLDYDRAGDQLEIWPANAPTGAAMVIESNGQVSIGVDNAVPTAKLEVEAAAGDNLVGLLVDQDNAVAVDAVQIQYAGTGNL